MRIVRFISTWWCLLGVTELLCLGPVLYAIFVIALVLTGRI